MRPPICAKVGPGEGVRFGIDDVGNGIGEAYGAVSSGVGVICRFKPAGDEGSIAATVLTDVLKAETIILSPTI